MNIAQILDDAYASAEREKAKQDELYRLRELEQDLSAALDALQSIIEMTGGYVADTSKAEWAKAIAILTKHRPTDGWERG